MLCATMFYGLPAKSSGYSGYYNNKYVVLKIAHSDPNRSMESNPELKHDWVGSKSVGPNPTHIAAERIWIGADRPIMSRVLSLIDLRSTDT